MRLIVEARLSEIKGGVEAFAPSMKLAGHGKDTEAALDCLRRGIVAWCAGLAARDRLQRTLKSKGLVWSEDAESLGIEVALNKVAVA